jgi:uncharacterized membrane protein HdeD (DUF308 family)
MEKRLWNKKERVLAGTLYGILGALLIYTSKNLYLSLLGFVFIIAAIHVIIVRKSKFLISVKKK